MLNTCKQHAELTFVVNDLLYTFYIPTLADGLRIFFWHMLVILYILYLRPAYPADDIAVYCTRIAGMKKQPPFAFFDSATLGMFEDVKDFRGMMRLSLMTPFIGPCIVPFNCEWRRSPLSLCMRACLSIWSDCLALGASRIPNERLLPIGIRYRLLSGFVRFHLRSKLLTCRHGGEHMPRCRKDSAMRSDMNSTIEASWLAVPTNMLGSASNNRLYWGVGRTICTKSTLRKLTYCLNHHINQIKSRRDIS